MSGLSKATFPQNVKPGFKPTQVCLNLNLRAGRQDTSQIAEAICKG